MNEQNGENRILNVDLKILLHDFLQVARRTIVFLLVLALLGCAAFCLREKRAYHPVYEASATFTVYVANPLQSEIRGYNSATAEQMAKTFPYILTSSALGELVSRDLGIASMPTVRASVLENTNIFTLSVTSNDPQLAWDALERIILYYPEVAERVVGPTILNLLDESGVPTEPANAPSYAGALEKGVLCALVLWLVLCLVRTLSRSTVHNEQELSRLMNLRCIGILPRVKMYGNADTCPRSGGASDEAGFSESVRLLRIRMEKQMQEQKVQVLLVSSAIAGEGKTTVALNLAMALAEHGKRTLLIDCDLRNPSVARNLGREDDMGFAQLLQGKLQARDIIHETELENLAVIYAGRPVSNAAELLSQPLAGSFVQACRTSFDCMILDTPPVSLLTDASELAAAADGALLTVRRNYAARREILESARILADSGLALLGCVMNYAAAGGSGGYSGYGYGKYYGSYHSTGTDGQ